VNRLELAGSGSNVLLTRRLVDAFLENAPGVNAVVHESIGTTGGLRAVADGVIDFALASRPVQPVERRGLSALRYARVAVVLAAHPNVSDDRLSSGDLLDVYAGKRERWSDGARIVVIQRERGDSGHRAISAVLPAFDAINDHAWRHHRYPVAYSDRAMEDDLARTPGAIGVADLGAISIQRLPLRVLAIDDVAPSVESVTDGRYRFSKDLFIVWRGAPTAAMQQLIEFLRSDAARSIIRDSGYLPAEREIE
jgi:phosphate transport system substrate-binding protein